MLRHWVEYQTSELIERGILEIGDGYRAKNSELASSGLPFARVANINNGFHFDGADLFPERDLYKVGEKVSRPGDVVFTSKGTVGRFAFVQSDTPRFVYSPQLSYWRSLDKNTIEPRFLHYWLQSNEFWLQAESVKGQTDMADYVSLADQRRMRITLPGIHEQRAIARILGTLDDKIDLNRRMNETLEAIAAAVFKSWFVDFDPVRVLSGQMPEKPPFLCAKALAKAGFPSSFQDSELGEIPKRWRTGTLGEVAKNPRRGVQPEGIRPSTPYIGLEHMPRRCIALSEWVHAEELESNKFEFKRREILFGKLRPYFHKVGVAPVDGVCSTDILVVTPKEPEWFGFLLGHVYTEEFVNHGDATSSGTKMPRTNWHDMARYRVVLPPQHLAGGLTNCILPLVERIITNIHESRTLAALRDALVPKLLSGEIRVTDIKEEAGGHA